MADGLAVVIQIHNDGRAGLLRFADTNLEDGSCGPSFNKKENGARDKRLASSAGRG
jgi:hypothetical protein